MQWRQHPGIKRSRSGTSKLAPLSSTFPVRQFRGARLSTICILSSSTLISTIEYFGHLRKQYLHRSILQHDCLNFEHCCHNLRRRLRTFKGIVYVDLSYKTTILFTIIVAHSRFFFFTLSISGHEQKVTHVSAHPTYNLVASSSADCTFRLWDFRQKDVREVITLNLSLALFL